MITPKQDNFEYAIDNARRTLLYHGQKVPNNYWQAIDTKGQMDMWELMNYNFSCKVSPDLEELREQIKPNLPWADDHFMERVGGLPINPGEQFKNWPFFRRQKENDRHRDKEGKHSHTYMERIWAPRLEGIRYKYGNLDDVVNLLIRDPYTRQAYLPLWFPEDTGSKDLQRVPCTLGYHFMYRNGEMHIWYPIRACDFFRHFRDDVYMASRLLLWMIDKLKARDPETWKDAKPGYLHMHIFSLHVFAQERNMLTKEGASIGPGNKKK